MTTQTVFDFATLPPEAPSDAAKRHYLAVLEGLTKPQRKAPAGRKPTEQLVSPAERIQLALNTLADETRALRAILEAPVFLASHRARAIRAAAEIEQATQIAETYFAMVKGRCQPKTRWRKEGDQ